ncbi:hypothetical protein CDAR_492551 [Caerostris darwini]|uniref:Uncharacterized protein n=1 Tax=Caerostris darwini TaxID=1538125 RepID=A0AAV4UZL3_9ARAC|nr:hypothetical protein CDAR_492551 [Caerostris darwini]
MIQTVLDWTTGTDFIPENLLCPGNFSSDLVFVVCHIGEKTSSDEGVVFFNSSDVFYGSRHFENKKILMMYSDIRTIANAGFSNINSSSL